MNYYNLIYIIQTIVYTTVTCLYDKIRTVPNIKKLRDVKYIIIVKIIYLSEFQVRTFFKYVEVLILLREKS